VIFSFGVVLIPSQCGAFVLISRLSTVFVLIVRLVTMFVFVLICRFVSIGFSADSMTLASSMLQIRIHDYSRHLNVVILIVGFVVDIRSFHAINSNAVSMFVDSSLLIFSEIEYVTISIDVFPMNLNELILLFLSKKNDDFPQLAIASLNLSWTKSFFFPI
jgi:hypothetical protein